MGQGNAVAGREAGLSRGPRRLARWCDPSGGGEYQGEEIYGRGQGGPPFLPEEMEARTVFPLRTGHAHAGRCNLGPLDEAVGGPYQSDSQSEIDS